MKVARIDSTLGVLITFGVTQTALNNFPGTRAVLAALGWTPDEIKEMERQLVITVAGPGHKDN